MKKLLGIIVILAALVLLGVWVSNRESTVAQNPNMSFLGTDWEWQRTDFANGTKIEAPKNGKFVINFAGTTSFNNTWSGKGDCNTINGLFTLSEDRLGIHSITSTKMACANGSLESEFINQLSQSLSYKVNDGELIITLADNASTMTFIRVYKTLQPTVSNPNTINLDDLTFRLTNFNGLKLPASQGYSLTFKDGKIATKFCNAMSGPYIIKDNVIKADLISTDMACSQPENIMLIETTFGSILQSGAELSLKDLTLILTGNNNQELIFVVVTQ